MDQNIFIATMICLSSSQTVFLFFYPLLMFIMASLFGIKEYKYYNKERVNCIIQNIKHNYAFKFDENDDNKNIKKINPKLINKILFLPK